MAKKSPGKKPKATSALNTEGAPEFARELPVDLTVEELAKKSDKLVNAELRLESQKAEKKAVVSEHNKSIKDTSEEIAALVAQLKAKTELRSVKCFERRDFATNKVDVIRCDNGQVVESRAMSLEDRQQELV